MINVFLFGSGAAQIRDVTEMNFHVSALQSLGRRDISRDITIVLAVLRRVVKVLKQASSNLKMNIRAHLKILIWEAITPRTSLKKFYQRFVASVQSVAPPGFYFGGGKLIICC